MTQEGARESASQRVPAQRATCDAAAAEAAHLIVLFVCASSSVVLVSFRWPSCARWRARYLYARKGVSGSSMEERRYAHETTLRMCFTSSCLRPPAHTRQ